MSPSCSSEIWRVPVTSIALSSVAWMLIGYPKQWRSGVERVGSPGATLFFFLWGGDGNAFPFSLEMGNMFGVGVERGSRRRSSSGRKLSPGPQQCADVNNHVPDTVSTDSISVGGCVDYFFLNKKSTNTIAQ